MANLSIPLPDDTMTKLVARAAARGLSVEDLVTPAVAPIIERLAEADAPSIERQKHALRELVRLSRERAGEYPAGFTLDDSRESIYGNRGR